MLTKIKQPKKICILRGSPIMQLLEPLIESNQSVVNNKSPKNSMNNR